MLLHHIASDPSEIAFFACVFGPGLFVDPAHTVRIIEGVPCRSSGLWPPLTVFEKPVWLVCCDSCRKGLNRKKTKAWPFVEELPRDCISCALTDLLREACNSETAHEALGACLFQVGFFLVI